MNYSELPLVSVIMGAHNGEKTIKKAICSALQQKYPHMEFIIGDDGSTDQTINIVSSLQEKDSRIKLIQNRINQGISKILNRCIENANGVYIANLDQDDFWIDKDKIHKQVSFLQKNPDVGVVGTNAIIANHKEGHYYSSVELSDQKLRKNILGTCPFIHSSVLYRKQIYKQTGGYPTDAQYCGDYAFRLKTGGHAHFANIGDYTTIYNINNNNTCYDKTIPQTIEALKLFLAYHQQYPNLITGSSKTVMRALSTLLSKHHPKTRKFMRKLLFKPNALPLDSLDVFAGNEQSLFL